jgi:hypothetical protein
LISDERSLPRAFPAPHERGGQLRGIRAPNAMRVRHLLGEQLEFFLQMAMMFCVAFQPG